MSADWTGAELELIEQALAALLPLASQPPYRLHQAMRYSVLGGGKRLRPLLCRAAAEAVAGEPVAAAMIPACAIELIHAYSLVHDDLPALDNDDLRRGRPTCHKAWGEATAILTGDALLTLAMAHLANLPAPALPGILREIGAAAGTPAGMVAGQAADLGDSAAGPADERVDRVHRYKTAAMIRAAVVSGGLAGGATAAEQQALAEFGDDVGLAFQIVDDILDITGTASRLGKNAGKDEAQEKLTWPAVHGLEVARRHAQVLAHTALGRLQGWGGAAEPLRDLAQRMVERDC